MNKFSGNVENLNIGIQIRNRRQIFRLSITTLSAKIGISKSMLSLIEANEKVPDLKLLFKLCNELEIEPHILLLKAHWDNLNEVNEKCWENNFDKLASSIEKIQSNFYDFIEVNPNKVLEMQA
jgi:transcriptional regulator with XRE-family HTH domain